MNNAAQTLDHLIDATRDELDALPRTDPEVSLTAEARWWADQRRRAGWARAILVVGTALVATMLWIAGRPLTTYVTVVLLLGMLGVAMVTMTWPSTWGQAIARGCLWAVALFAGSVWWIFVPIVVGLDGAIEAYAIPGSGGAWGATADLAALLAPLLALLVLGMHGFERPSERVFRPVAFRRLLALSLVMGLADAALLLSVGVSAWFADRVHPAPWLIAVCLIAGAWGLALLRTWGLAVMAAGNLAEIVLLLVHPEALLGPEMFVLLITAAVQILLPAPVYGAMLAGQSPAGPLTRLEKWLPPLLLGGLTATAVISWLVLVHALISA